jgi:CubicO group peptidase (beta-lactamase class C family)
MTPRSMSPQGRRALGSARADLEAVKDQFNAYLAADPDYSAQLAIYHHGELVVDLVGGPQMVEESLTGVFSVTKGVAAVTTAVMIEAGLFRLDDHVVRYWPQFAAHGKDRVTIGQLLSHQAGLVNTVGGLAAETITLDSQGAADQLALARPLWEPGSAFGYHGLTIGIFMEELVRRITGGTLQQLYDDQVRRPRKIDFYLGLPEKEERRYHPILPYQPAGAQVAEQLAEPDGLAALAVSSVNRPIDLTAGPISPNRREVRAAGNASAGGVGCARGLAGVYAAALGTLGEPLFSEETVATISQQQVFGHDRVLNEVLGHAMVFQVPQPPRLAFGSYRAFGHDGAGGAIGYIPSRIASLNGTDPKSIQLSQLTRRILAGHE